MAEVDYELNSIGLQFKIFKWSPVSNNLKHGSINPHQSSYLVISAEKFKQSNDKSYVLFNTCILIFYGIAFILTTSLNGF